MDELTLPAFELDCRDWLVAEPGEAGLPEEVGGAPVLAVLSTAVIGALKAAAIPVAPPGNELTRTGWRTVASVSLSWESTASALAASSEYLL